MDTLFLLEMLGEEVRWVVYNLAFKLLGDTRLWPRLGFVLWR